MLYRNRCHSMPCKLTLVHTCFKSPRSKGRLDVSRKTLSENIEDMQSIAEEVKKKYGLHKLQLCMHMKRGYHFTIHKKFLELKDFPDEFIQIDIGKKIYRFSSVELRQLNSRYQDTLQEIWRLTEVELGDLLNEIFEADFLLAVHQLCDSVAILDCLTSFVTYSSLCPTSTQRAKLTEGGPIALQQAYHPTLAHVKPQSTVPNDIFLDETSALHIVTGRNQSGKSTYLRTIGLICVLAHTGCPVPAKFASVRLLNRICTRFNTGDDISQLQSHFSKEMHDVAALFEGLQGDKGQPRRDQPITPHREGATIYPDTLVLIDELGRSTSTVDGFAIALAIAEKLAAWPNVLTLFATHFLGFGALQSVNPEIKNFHLSSTTATATAGQQSSYQDGDPDIKFNYTVVEGISEDKCYGIETARLAGIPREVVEDAEDLQKQVPTRRIGNPGDFSATNFQLTEREKEQIRKTSSIISIAQRLNLIRASTTNAPERRRLLCEFQEKLKGASRRSKSENG